MVIEGTSLGWQPKVAILADEGSCSAAEILLSAFKGSPRVRLFGRPSGGGSGRPRPHRLLESGLVVQLSSMLSYRPDGLLFEGRGVEPDCVVPPSLTDVLGEGDATLSAALQWLS